MILVKKYSFERKQQTRTKKSSEFVVSSIYRRYLTLTCTNSRASTFHKLICAILLIPVTKGPRVCLEGAGEAALTEHCPIGIHVVRLKTLPDAICKSCMEQGKTHPGTFPNIEQTLQD